MGDKNVIKKNDPDGNDDLTYRLTFKDVVDILEVIDHSDSQELHIEAGDLKLSLIRR